ncbi:hypothetical protein C2R22_15905 [Salinigranum rubrum]|uniref:Uncharacterized protein n=1 Tax=Salinigranum rubrum TaxID=755307 RepID=A0A2I8VLY5_9EURY|nr:hypothetical protein [Salinigranum rubrum]AUV82943.1 hypothetical protein C2R22_15905 [Salinigranum rubrum]
MTRFKLVPEPPDSVERVAEAQRAVPLVPGTEDDCCARLVRRLGFPSRDVARTWLTFLRALELAEERDAGFVRLSRDPTREHLQRSLLDRVYGAQEVLDALGAEPSGADAVFERFEERVPEWEHYKDPSGWRETWRERVGYLLGWLVLLDLAEHRDDGYVAGRGVDSDGSDEPP